MVNINHPADLALSSFLVIHKISHFSFSFLVIFLVHKNYFTRFGGCLFPLILSLFEQVGLIQLLFSEVLVFYLQHDWVISRVKEELPSVIVVLPKSIKS